MALPVYPSDLTDAEWALLSRLLPPARPGGRPRSVNLRRVIKGLFYLVRAGCASDSGRYVPRDYGPWSTVYHYFRQFRRDGTWEQVHTHLRELARAVAFVVLGALPLILVVFAGGFLQFWLQTQWLPG